MRYLENGIATEIANTLKVMAMADLSGLSEML